MSKQVYIYGLYDPDTGELRYIGKTNNLVKRLWHHIKDAKLGQKTYKATWIRKLLNEGKKPVIGVIQETAEENWQIDEIFCIAQAEIKGTKLTNLTSGGDGLVGYNHSQEVKNRISETNKQSGKIPPSWKGRKQSPEHIRKRVEARKKKGNYKHSEETKQKISRNRKGKALGNTNTLGYKHTEEWKQTMSERMKGKGNHFFGREHTEQTKKKISDAKKRKREVK